MERFLILDAKVGESDNDWIGAQNSELKVQDTTGNVFFVSFTIAVGFFNFYKTRNSIIENLNSETDGPAPIKSGEKKELSDLEEEISKEYSIRKNNKLFDLLIILVKIATGYYENDSETILGLKGKYADEVVL